MKSFGGNFVNLLSLRGIIQKSLWKIIVIFISFSEIVSASYSTSSFGYLLLCYISAREHDFPVIN